MELGQILLAQIVVIFSLLFIILNIDSTLIHKYISKVLYSTYFKIGDDKGIFLFTFLLYMLITICILEIIRLSCQKNFMLRDRILYIQKCNYNNSFFLFVNFISAYIYKSLNNRLLNLFLFSMLNNLVYMIFYLVDLKILSGFFYLNYIICNCICIGQTFVKGFDRFLNEVVRYYTMFRMFK